MPSFSFTAPIITAEQEWQEWNSMTPEERELIQKDIRGQTSEDGAEETPSTSHQPLDSNNIYATSDDINNETFQQALLEIADKEKKELLHAMEVAPHLVAMESNPMTYMRRLSPMVAAYRIAQYWKHRRRLFGDARAFLPMTLDGAMEDIFSCLEKGFLNVLPKDPSGRAVIFFDRIRAIPAVASRDSVLRVIFYILQKVAMQDEVISNGFVFMENIAGYDLYTHFDRLLMKTQMLLLRECFPAELKVFHVFAGSCGAWAMDLIMPVIKQLAGKRIRLRMVCHSGHESVESFCKTYNFRPEHLSVIVGGGYTYANHMSWMDMEYAREQEEQSRQRERDGLDPTFPTSSASDDEEKSRSPSRRRSSKDRRLPNASLPDASFCTARKISLSGTPRAA